MSSVKKSHEKHKHDEVHSKINMKIVVVAAFAVIIMIVILILSRTYVNNNLINQPEGSSNNNDYLNDAPYVVIIDNMQIAPTGPEANQPFSIYGTLKYNGSGSRGFDIIINFGDKLEKAIHYNNTESSSFSALHTYIEAGSYTIVIEIQTGSAKYKAAEKNIVVHEQTMHAECKLESCVFVPGAGEYTCTSDNDCAGVSGLEPTITGSGSGGGSGSGSGGGGTSSGADPIPSVVGDIAVADILIAHGEVNETVDVAVNAILENHGSSALAAIGHAIITYDGVFEQSADLWLDLSPGAEQNVYLGTKTLVPGEHDITVQVSIDNFVDTRPENNILTEYFDVR